MSIASMPGEDERIGGVVAPSTSIGGVNIRSFSSQHPIHTRQATPIVLTTVIPRLEEVRREERPSRRWRLRTKTIVSTVQDFLLARNADTFCRCESSRLDLQSDSKWARSLAGA
jgi:hypothetical protein